MRDWLSSTPARLGLVAVVAVVVATSSAVVATGTQPYETYAAKVAGDGPVADYRFDDATGAKGLADSAGGSAATNEGITLGGEGPFPGSKSGSFGGSAFATLPGKVLEGASAFTAEAWVDWSGGSSYKQPIFDLGSGSTSYTYLTPATSASGHKLLFEIHPSSGPTAVATAPKLGTSAWHYVAVSETSAGVIQLYLDGEPSGEKVNTTVSPSTLGALSAEYLGKSLIEGDPKFNGSLSNVAFYSKALTGAQIHEHYVDAEFPVNGSLPTVSGSAKEGTVLNAKPGTWTGLAPISFGYQWQRCNAEPKCVNVPGATLAKYTPGETDVGSTLDVAVTGENPTALSSTATSPQTAPVEGTVPLNTALPVISGAATEGQELTAGSGSWTGTKPLEYSYKWEHCNTSGSACAAIAGATARSFTLTSAQVGQTIRVVVTAKNSVGSKSSTAEATAVVTIALPRNTSPPVISGIASESQPLTVSTGAWSGSPSGYTYAWQRCTGPGEGCTAIAGASSASYAPRSEDVGKYLRSTVTATNAGGSVAATAAAARIAHACTDSWVGATSGSWSASANWSRGAVPAASDVACVGSADTVQVTAGSNTAGALLDAGSLSISGGTLQLTSTGDDSRLASLALGAGTLGGPAGVEVYGSFNWTDSGALTGSGTTVLQPGSSALINAESGCNPMSLAGGRTLLNETTLTYQWGTLFMSEGARLQNKGSLVLATQSACFTPQIQLPAGNTTAKPSIVNNGAVVAAGHGNTYGIGVRFSNQGIVEAHANRLEFSGGGVPRELAEGSWTVESGGTIVLVSGTYWIGEAVNLSAVQVTGATVKHTIDSTFPTGSLTAPGPYLSGTLPLQGTASDAAGVTAWAVQIVPTGSSAWQTLCEATSATGGSTFGCSASTTSYADGAYQLRALITDAEENTTATAAVNTSIDNTAPTGSLSGLGQYARGTVGVQGTAHDAGSGVASWQLQLAATGQSTWQNACEVQTKPNEAGEYACQLDTATVTDGSYQLRVSITDNAGNTYLTPTVSTVIDNTPPSGAVTAPGQALKASAEVRGSATEPAPESPSGSCRSPRRAKARGRTRVQPPPNPPAASTPAPCTASNTQTAPISCARSSPTTRATRTRRPSAPRPSPTCHLKTPNRRASRGAPKRVASSPRLPAAGRERSSPTATSGNGAVPPDRNVPRSKEPANPPIDSRSATSGSSSA